jgi:ribose transport system ATP-binding protein
LLLPQSVGNNFALGNFPDIARKGGWIDEGRLKKMSQRQIDAMQVRCSSLHQPVEELSGGNQQKVIIGRWLEKNARILLFDEPTRGVDVGTKFEIYHLLGAEADKGKALVVVSSELRELMLICDRIGVLSAGKLVQIFPRDEWTRDALLAAAFSGYTNN